MTVASLAACGGAASDSGAGGESTSTAQSPTECSRVGSEAIAIVDAVSYYKATGDKNKLVLDTGTKSDTIALVADPEKLAETITRSNQEFSSATTDSRRNEILKQQRANYSSFRSLCDSVLSDADKKIFDSYDKYFPTAIPKPDADSVPTTIEAPEKGEDTKPGTVVKIGEPVYIEYSDDGKRCTFEYTINAVDKGRNEVGQLICVRAAVKSTAKTTSVVGERIPSLTRFSPSLVPVTSDGSEVNSLILFGTSSPCKNEPMTNGYEGSNLCTVFALSSKSANVKEVAVTRFSSDDEYRDKPLYIWTVT